ncbi:hypothetical protein HMPREF9080_00872 [Cardiobacterium valvarum F0432]|uniref:Uncharacterized protein n=1 Tax=Cardiobacterium valvarum F0432 TaxID=797473 RepID=G9ZDN8_9GAMM|nr:hypothetical protein HMPREF9080_00872 [Cardiobacterium valvarum F0432]
MGIAQQRGFHRVVSNRLTNAVSVPFGTTILAALFFRDFLHVD